jgi:transcriptional regulator with XRE-family HTH domain
MSTNNIDSTIIGNNIRKIREIKGLKQENLAKNLGITTNGYGKIERGESSINIDRLNQIAEALGVSTLDILQFDAGVVYNIQNMQNSAPHGTVNNYSFTQEERDILLNQINGLRDIIQQQKEIISLLTMKIK